MTTSSLNTNLTSTGAKNQIQDLMNRLNNPNLTSVEYSQIRYEFVKLNEASFNQIYDDKTGKTITTPSQAKGYVSIGVGFNMDRGQEARTEWNAAFGGSISFDDVYNNRVQLNENQVRQLYDYSVSVRESEVSAIYKNVNLTPAQRLVVEDMYFNTPSLVNGKVDSNGKYTGTNFFKNLDQYVKTSDQTYLDNVLKEILENSNKSEGQLLIGLSNRRLKEAAILSGDADIKLPDSEVRELFNANKEKFDVIIDGKSAKEYFDNQIKANGLTIDTSLFFDESKFYTFESDSKTMLADSGLIRSDALSVLEESIIKLKDSEGKEFSLVKDVWLPLKDGTIAAVNTVIDAIDSAQATTDAFMNHYMYQLTSIFTTGAGLAGLISDVNAGIQRGDAPEQIAKTIALKALVQTVGDQIKNEFILSEADQVLFDANPSLAMSADKLGQEGVMSQTGQDAINNFANNHPVYNAAYLMAISMATTLLLNADEGWDSQEYTVAAAQATAQVAAQIAVSEAVKAGWFGTGASAGATGAGVGAAAAYLISASVNDLFADDHMNSHQWQSTFVSAGVVGIAAYAGFSAAAYLIGGAIAGPIGAIVAGIIVSQFMGGKEYGAGEYPDPYSYLKIEAKEDGTGNRIIGIESEGVVAIAREYYHDDLYGNSGSDNLIGKSGTNTIYGYGGNDHLEGRGDIDLLIAGDGNDEAFGGNGDDTIYGGNGSDNLFGGNGNDVIIGGTGASVGGSGSLEDGADFIQGGNGDDQIMGEAGDDTIQGNAGNDTILGGTGNDRIEGNEGDDSILGEDGNDMILGQEGSDIIDGGAGADYIEGNEGNDNIRGGDNNDEIFGNSGVDIIYGDAGNDLINTGSENDLVFGGLGNDIIYGADGDDTLSGELGNDYVIGAEGADTIDGGAGDDVLFGGIGDDIITTGEGNDTIIYRTGDGQDTINDTDTEGSNTLKLSEINSKLSDNTTNKIILTKSGTDLIIEFKDDSGSIITGDKITVTNQFGGAEENGSGSEILKKIEFADGKAIANDNFLTERKIQKLKRN